MRLDASGGLWPVMITPFTAEGEIDYASLERLIAWYEERGATGLFAACQSSEVFYLSLRERAALVAFVKNHAHVPVIASGHISHSLTDQIAELKQMCAAGADAVILISNRLAGMDESEEVFMASLRAVMQALPGDVPLGFYECPYPYKRLLTDDALRFCADSGRFYFMKDTCCDIGRIRNRLVILEGSNLKLFNANTSTLLDSLRAGAAGFSGVMMNFHPELYHWLMRNWRQAPENAALVHAYLTMFAFIERQVYPVNAKYHLCEIAGVIDDPYTRVTPNSRLSETGKLEVRKMALAAEYIKETFCR